MQTLRGSIGAIVAMAVLAACGQVPVTHPVTAGSAQALQTGETPLNEAPKTTVVVPHSPSHGPNPVVSGNYGTLSVFPTETLPALKALINGAQKSLYFETFNFGNDSMGKQIYPLLIAKAKAGLEVKVVADYVGTRFIPGHADMVKQMRAAGIDFRLYKPRLMIKDDKKAGINITHRKVYLADGERALIGGVNLMAPFDYDVQDVLIEWKGPIVPQLYGEFAYDWRAANGGDLNQLPVTPVTTGPVTAQVVVTSPPEGRFEARDAIYKAVDLAQDEIRIENQYLWDAKLVQRLLNAMARGVKLHVIVPGDEDHGVFKFIHSETLKKLQDAGAQCRLYVGIDPQAHLHVKYFGVDGRLVAIGSANGDTRGLMDNQELDTVIHHAGLCAEFKARLFEKDWTQFTKPFVYRPGPDIVHTKPFQTLLEIIEYYS
ncbi:MAG: cardiolipin synthase [Cyanobacteria bacterium RYN_339]|nr:cardiolipin synthase [Cyanobacteria bacterium RYN_339]